MIADGSGKDISFRNTIIIMTSNAGASLMEKDGIGFNTSSNGGDKEFEIDLDTIKNLFKPELRNRLSGVVPFNYLNIHLNSCMCCFLCLLLSAYLATT